VTRRDALRPALAAALAAAVAVTIAPAATSAMPSQEDFRLTGEVGGLYPGIESTVPVAITNPQSFAIDIVSVDVTALDAGSGCPGSVLTFDGVGSTVAVPAGGTVTVSVEVRLDPAAPDACQGATWPLVFTGSATSPDEGPGAGRTPTGGSGSGARGLATTGAGIAGLVAIGLAMVGVGAWIRRRARRRA
jgi:LPXTG-motif cell wall-anchored protein